MRHRGPALSMLTLAAAISSEIQAAVVANTDNLTLLAGQASTVSLASLLANDTRPSGYPVFIDTIGIGSNSNSRYLDSAGQPADPFQNQQQTPFVILCPFDASNGSLAVDDSGQLVYEPEFSGEGEDSFSYSLQEYEFSEGQWQTVDSSSADVNLTLAAQVAEGLAALTSNPNRQRVAQSLDRMCNGNVQAMSSDLAARCADLLVRARDNPEGIDAILAQITPEEALALRRLAADVVRHQSDLVYRQQQARRGVQSADGDIALGGNILTLLNYRGGNAGDEGAGRWSSFVSVRQDETDFSGSDLEAPYEVDTAALTLGADYRLNPQWVAGLALGWANQDLSFGERAGTVDADVHNLTAYVSRAAGRFNLDAQLGYARGDNAIERNIRYGDLATVAEGDTGTDLYSAGAQLDWNWAQGALEVRPYLRLDYLRAQVEGYREQGGMGWAMQVGDQDMSQWTASVGVATAHAFSFRWGVLVPGLDLGVLSQASRDYSPVAFRFLGDSSGAGDFTLLSEGEDSLFYQYEFNLVAVMKRGASAFIGYRGTADHDNTDSQQLSFGGRLEF